MKDGKLSEVAFKRSVLPAVKRIDAGFDSSFCMRTALVTGNEEGVAYLAALRAINALTAVPGEPESVAITISLPRDFSQESRFQKGAAPEAAENAVKAVMAEIEKALAGRSIAVADVAVEVTGNSMITVAVTACGKATVCRQPARKNIVMVGLTGAAGSAMLSRNHHDQLVGRYTADFLSASDRLLSEIDITDRARAVLAAENYKTFIQPVSDGGVFGAIWSLCDQLSAGCEIEIKDIPIKQATIEVSEFFDINPYILRGDGAFLYVTDKEADTLSQGVVIGHLTKSADRVVINGETRSFLTPVREDSYFDVK